MTKSTRRGYSPDDEHDFKGSALDTLKRSTEELYFLLNRGYSIKGSSVFVGNHYLLSERQRIAMTRVVSSETDIAARKEKKKRPETLSGETVNIDGFNVIITLEVAQSGSPVFACMDSSYRDLAGLRGTYSLIDKTDAAIRLILSELRTISIKRAVFWLDAPVSNSGRLKARIAEIAEAEQFETGIEITGNVDQALYDCPNVISSDSIILDRCPGWLNLNERIIPKIPGAWIVDLIS
ncbi:MAG TPA: DUF434 domain-containing protein [Bacillota bacterium]|nr:DUF434 domain-containing protein [Bacillota bacterium]